MNRNRIIISLITMVTFMATTAMGLWQLSRADQKIELARQLELRRAMPAVNLGGHEDASFIELFSERSVHLRGRWVADKTVYLDNRQMDGQPGFWVMTPLQLDPTDVLVVVQRGWVPRNFQNRMAVPVVDTPATEVVLEGRIASHAGKLLELGSGPEGQIRQNLNLPAYAQEVGRHVLPFIVLQEGPDNGGLRRQWPRVDTGVQKHYGYAFQWFGLSTLWVTLYVWFQIIIPRKKRAST